MTKQAIEIAKAQNLSPPTFSHSEYAEAIVYGAELPDTHPSSQWKKALQRGSDSDRRDHLIKD